MLLDLYSMVEHIPCFVNSVGCQLNRKAQEKFKVIGDLDLSLRHDIMWKDDGSYLILPRSNTEDFIKELNIYKPDIYVGAEGRSYKINNPYIIIDKRKVYVSKETLLIAGLLLKYFEIRDVNNIVKKDIYRLMYVTELLVKEKKNEI